MRIPLVTRFLRGRRATRGAWGRRPIRRRWLLLFPLIFAFAGLAIMWQPHYRSEVRACLRDPSYTKDAVSLLYHYTTAAVKNLLTVKPPPVASELPTLHLFVPGSVLGRMRYALLNGKDPDYHSDGGWKPYFNCVLQDSAGRYLHGEVSLRGACEWHHRPEKPSFRIKLDTDEIVEGRRFIELQRPEDVLGLKNWLPSQVAEKIGLFTDRADHVRLFVNNKFFGVYARTMRPGQALAIANGRMPGTFFKGDSFIGSLWSGVERWNLFGDQAREDIAYFDEFLALLRERPSPERLEKISEMFDFEAFARRSAVFVVTGSVHIDQQHNHLYYLSSTRGKIEAIPWDCNSYGIHSEPDVPPNIVTHPIMAAISADPRWIHRRNEWIRDLLATHAHEDNITRLVDDALRLLEPDLRADGNLGAIEWRKLGVRIIPYTPADLEPAREQLLGWTRERNKFLRGWLRDARVFVEELPGRPGWSRVEVAGAVAVRAALAAGGAPRVAGLGDTLLYPGVAEKLEEYVSCPAGYPRPVTHAPLAPLVYEVEALPADLRFTNAITGEAVEPKHGESGSHVKPRSFHPSLLSEPVLTDVVLGPGVVEITQDLHTQTGQRLIIRPGTSLRLAAGTGIYARGPTLVLGDADAPIDIRGAGPEPWGAFGVCGEATGGSRFAYVDVAGGSVGRDGGVRFKGMLSIHGCPDVVLEDCTFGANFAGDDAVNIAESRLQIERCRWSGARADSLDLDMCQGTLRACTFEGSGNDGLDLMTSQVSVRDCIFRECGDKGISIGQRTHATIENCTIERCQIGVTTKDDARALIVRTSFRDNGTALHTYRKRWEYVRGGTTALVDCTMDGSATADMRVERLSRVELVRTPMGTVRGERLAVSESGTLDPEWNLFAGTVE